MGIREALEGIQRRRVVVPIPVKDAGPARQRLLEAYQAAADAAATAEQLPDGGEVGDAVREALTAAVEAAQADVAACYANVELASPNYVDAERVSSRHIGVDGGTDYDQALPEYLALCCTDTELQDVEWWREQLSRPEWGPDIVHGLLMGVLHLVADVVRPVYPKG